MARSIVIGLLTGIIAVGVAWILSRRESRDHATAPSPASRDNEDRVAELEADLARMRREMQSLSARSKMPPPPSNELAAAMAQAQSNNKKAAAAEDPDVAMEKGRQAIAAKFDQLSIAMARQDRDPAWAESAEKELGTVVRQLQESGVKGVTVLNSECKSSMCKVDVAYDNHQAQVQVSDRIRSPLFAGGEVRRYEENGQLRSTAYYYRQGYDRPM
jgi:hypothetical protein